MHTIVSLILVGTLALGTTNGQQLRRILRDDIFGNSGLTDQLISLSHATGNADTDGVPYTGGEDQWRLPLFNGTGFSSPNFALDTATPTAPDYAIYAVEVRNNLSDGACERTTSQLTRITRMVAFVGNNTINEVSSYLDPGSDELNLDRMGLSSTNNLIRFSFPRLDGDEVTFSIESTDPTFQELTPRYICLQVEFFGVRTNQSPPPPPINNGALLQYNMFAPTLRYLDESYDDRTYNGAKGTLYTGGTGVLTDGIIGTDPVESPQEWAGFHSPDKDRVGLRLFLNTTHPVSQVCVYYWLDTANDVVAPTGGLKTKAGMMTQATFQSTPVVAVPGLNTYCGVATSLISLDYLVLTLMIGEDRGVLLTEVSVTGADFTTDILTNLQESQKMFRPPLPTTSPSATNPTSSPTNPTSSNNRPPPPTSLPINTIIFAVVGVVGCCFASAIIIVVAVVFVIIVIYLRKTSKHRPSQREVVRNGSSILMSSSQHSSLVRKLSDKYLGMAPPSYSEFKTQDNGDYASADNLYQQVDRPLPLPPIPGQERSELAKDESYIEMVPSNRPDLRIDVNERNLKAMRTLSEDDYAAVTPPSAPADAKQPPERLESTPYVVVTPPHSPRKQGSQVKEENYESVTPPESSHIHNLSFTALKSVPNDYS